MTNAPHPNATLSREPWTRRIRFHHLDVLRVIAQHGSLTAAARALGITQPAVSQWLADIESAAGEKLFLRGQRLRPTPFLAPVLAHAHRVLNDAQRLSDELHVLRAGGSGRVRIGTMQVGAVALVPAVVMRLRNQAPGIEVSLVEDVAAGLWVRLERNELDLLVTRLEQRALGSGLPHRRLFADQHRVVCGPGHPLIETPELNWAEVVRWPWLMPTAGTPLRRAIEDTIGGQGLALPTVLLSSVSPTINPQLMAHTQSLAVMSSVAARHFEGLGLVRCLNLTLTHDIGDVGLVWREVPPGEALSVVLKAFRQELSKTINPPEPATPDPSSRR